MAWEGSERNKRNPKGWAKQRLRILKRDGYECQICHKPGADTVDHIVNLKRGGTHDDSNLQAVHAHPCHVRKTAIEARANRPSRYREPERHPGLR